ncbi:acetyl-CoA synthetase [Endobacter medicaginis]|uniref:Acetate--CoA ligase n=1 Tax=Endobacter medicaginis TaxID=1181271 RepID=A0A850NZC8_9PROT|nr:acetate--CoA ligase [Endobacter medicaginis]MBB3173765.1 acetyl-CoA synthetase [Endobacter medicaginis]MCX5474956.1 acetate--CoA ligase [Endobacter medicaginis]NVN31207.1 acetate--CoA ligase [Endobacter medicaginis]
MSDSQVFHVKPAMAASAQVDATQYRLMTNHAEHDADAFWLEQARTRLDWVREPTLGCNAHFSGDHAIRWFEDGLLNVSANCLDRHLATRADDIALIWVGDEEGVEKRLSFRDLHEQVCRFANVLKDQGVRRGDRVAIFLPMVPEAAVAMLACTRIGAVHSVMFAGFSASSVAGRLEDCGAKVVVTADEGRRGGKRVRLKAIIDEALEAGGSPVETVIVLRVTGAEIARQPGRDLDYAELMAAASPDCTPEPMAAEDPLFILYTSGSTGKPKGVLHTTGGYLLWAAFTHSIVFDYRPGEVYWCTADIGWITGHSYGIYGPLANGATTLMFEGVPTYPDAGRWWRIIDQYQVTTFYTAPTAIRALMTAGDAPVKASSRASLRVIATVGETINPEAWLWYYHVVGEGRVPLVDTWWQTETGGHLIAGPAAIVAQKPGSATLPIPGVLPVLLDEKGQPVEGEGEGALCVAKSWPGQMRTLWGDHDRFIQSYFSTYPGYYFSGDGGRRDADGYYWVTGRMDDVINVSGHRIGSAEVESALAHHPAVAEAAVVGVPHDLKGQALFAFVILCASDLASLDAAGQRALCDELARHAGSVLGRYAAPDHVLVVPDLPKTRSGKIMRRVLRKIATNELDSLGDTSTLADPSVVDAIVERLRARDVVTAQ